MSGNGVPNIRFSTQFHLSDNRCQLRRSTQHFVAGRPPWRATSRHTEQAARSRPRAISRIEQPEAIPREMSSRSAKVSAHRERRRAAGGIPPRGNNTARMQLCGLSKARPISCSDSPAFQRLQTSRFSIAESPNRIPGLMPTPPLQRRFTSDGVASTYRMHPRLPGTETRKLVYRQHSVCHRGSK